MPYIPREARKAIDSWLAIRPGISTTGELNYAITKLVLSHLGWPNVNVNYDMLQDAIGTLECVKAELYRRMVSPYENQKRDENGDVFA